MRRPQWKSSSPLPALGEGPKSEGKGSLFSRPIHGSRRLQVRRMHEDVQVQQDETREARELHRHLVDSAIRSAPEGYPLAKAVLRNSVPDTACLE